MAWLLGRRREQSAEAPRPLSKSIVRLMSFDPNPDLEARYSNGASKFLALHSPLSSCCPWRSTICFRMLRFFSCHVPS
jgi:hypothetical protein